MLHHLQSLSDTLPLRPECRDVGDDTEHAVGAPGKPAHSLCKSVNCYATIQLCHHVTQREAHNQSINQSINQYFV